MKWIPQVELQTRKQLKKLRSDNGGEFFSGKFSEWLGLRGVVQQSTPSYSPKKQRDCGAHEQDPAGQGPNYDVGVGSARFNVGRDLTHFVCAAQPCEI